MIGLLFALLLFQAGTPMGAVTGIVRSAPGTSAAGVRVYAQQVRDAADPTALTAPLEGLVQTDASGRYRIELAAGRYYIASGSVSAPTYYPGTTNLASAKVVTVTSGGTVEGIDFGSFVAAARTNNNINLLFPGTLAGTVRFPDGSPAANIRVVAFSTSVPLPPNIVAPGTAVPRPAQTDAAGRYQIGNVPPGGHYIVAGYAETSGFHTGDSNSTQPKAIVVASSATTASLDITIPFPPPRTGTTVTGKVLSRDGLPAVGATVQIFAPRPSASASVPGAMLPSINLVPDATVAGDGTFTFSNVVPGFYNARVAFSNVNKFEMVDVGNSPVTGLQFSLPAAIFGGTILLEDGSPVPDPELFVSGVLTIASPNLVISTVLPISADGTFSGLPDTGESRFYFRNLPEEYEIRSITAGSIDLMKEPVRFDGTKSFVVEARVVRRSASPVPSSVRVVGTALDGSGRPSVAARVQLCCLSPGSMEGLSAPLRPDGSFEFANVSPGVYMPEFRVKTGQAAIKVMSANVVVEADHVKLQLISGSGAAPPLGTIEISKKP